jgi:hypothetical protein
MVGRFVGGGRTCSPFQKGEKRCGLFHAGARGARGIFIVQPDADGSRKALAGLFPFVGFSPRPAQRIFAQNSGLGDAGKGGKRV